MELAGVYLKRFGHVAAWPENVGFAAFHRNNRQLGRFGHSPQYPTISGRVGVATPGLFPSPLRPRPVHEQRVQLVQDMPAHVEAVLRAAVLFEPVRQPQTSLIVVRGAEIMRTRAASMSIMGVVTLPRRLVAGRGRRASTVSQTQTSPPALARYLHRRLRERGETLARSRPGS